MRNRNVNASLVASPVLVGAVTVLITIVAVFIAYNANAGLPFVPTYDLKAQLPTGNKLVEGNEVRVGGFRAGVVDKITPKVVQKNGETKAIAVVAMKLDKTVEPLSKDTQVKIRPRSALGLKYVEITPGSEKANFAAGDTMPLASSTEGLELEDIFSTFDGKTRRNSQKALSGFGDAFTGRGGSLNNSIVALNPFFSFLTPVMQVLNDPKVKLDRFFIELGRTTAQVAPVARIQADVFANMATTFAAIGESPTALRQTIERSPSTIDTAVRSFRVQRPFLVDATDLFRRLRPAVNELPRSLPAINRAFKVGIPVLPRTVGLNRDLGDTFDALDKLAQNPNTLLAIRDLRTTNAVLRPALEYVAPYQTVCNYFNYFVFPLGEHQSQVSALGGTQQEQGVRLPNNMQPNSLGSIATSRNVDTPPGVNPVGAKDASGQQLNRRLSQINQPAIDAQGNADCQVGQNGFPAGKLSNGRYGPGLAPDGSPSGGNSPIDISNYPILSGGTFVSRKLGINNLKDVDKLK
ncbi:MAG: MlaD family protein [Thermoleophilaceae bacterium]